MERPLLITGGARYGVPDEIALLAREEFHKTHRGVFCDPRECRVEAFANLNPAKDFVSITSRAHLARAFSILPKSKQQAFLALWSRTPSKDHAENLIEICWANCVGLGIPGTSHGAAAVCEVCQCVVFGRFDALIPTVCMQIISRLNHSCLPNSTRMFNYKDLSFELRAVRSISAGEEITMSYRSNGSPPPLADRQSGLLETCTSSGNYPPQLES